MYLTEKLSSEINTIYIDLTGGNISVRTHSQPELIIDARKMRYVGLIPQMECIGNTAYIHKQALTAFFPQREKATFKILVPDNKILAFKMFAGEININGTYNSLTVKLRTGSVIIDGPYFSISNNSTINVTAGSIIQRRLIENNLKTEIKNDRETLCLFQTAKLHSKVFLGEVSIS